MSVVGKLWDQGSLWSVFSLSCSAASDMIRAAYELSCHYLSKLLNSAHSGSTWWEPCLIGLMLCPWWMISAVRLDILSHQSSQWRNNEQGDWWPWWPVPLWSLVQRDGLWLLSWVWDTWEVGVLVESWVAGGVLAVGHAHLSVKVLSWVKVPRREAAWRHSALTRACSRFSREAHVCREKHTTRGTRDWNVGGKDCLQQMMAPLILLWSQTDAVLELLDSGTHTNNWISLNQQM